MVYGGVQILVHRRLTKELVFRSCICSIMSDSLETIVMDATTTHNNHGRSDVSQYTNVLHKADVGDLILSTSKMVFQSKSKNGSKQSENTAPSLDIEWKDIVKHQVSPAKYPKPLLKVLFTTAYTGSNNVNNSNLSVTFQMENREFLEKIRKDITNRIHHRDRITSSSNVKKRPYSELKKSSNTSFGALDPTAIAVTRAALLASDAALRQQYQYLVSESNTVSEDDFWETHQHLLEDEYARIAGMARPGSSSLLQSHLPSSGRVTLGVEEMRQIFILYPAVHKAYEEKVPLELSDEQFWRKYLESEYFHRDRGRIGTAARNHAPMDDAVRDEKKREKNGGPTFEQQEARAAAVGSDDIFSRYDQKLKEEAGMNDSQQTGAIAGNNGAATRQWGTNLAVGQFDLASTLETERSKLLEGPKDNYPANQNDDGKGSRVIQKYNRHWAMVLYPEEAVAGSNLLNIARRSVCDVLPGSGDASVLGGVDTEMRRLVDFAAAREDEANHASGLGLQDGHEYETLTLRNIEAYFAGNRNSVKELSDDAKERHFELSKKMRDKTMLLVKKIVTEKNNPHLPESCFPLPSLGRELLTALTKKMALASETEAHSLEMANKLPQELRNRIQTYFRRSSELLRHFFGLRRLSSDNDLAKEMDAAVNVQTSQKLARIVGGLDTLYREMDTMRKGLAQTETDEMMRKMCLPIMDQLDWAFKLYREGSGGGSGGGFVTVEEL
jgi:transcription initiation factor TFIIH subunit 1